MLLFSSEMLCVVAGDVHDTSLICGDRLGWGIRLPQAAVLGCIPVIIQDGVHQYFDDTLPYRKCALYHRLAPMTQGIKCMQAALHI